MKLIKFILALAFIKVINCEVFSSTDGLSKLFDNGKEFVESLKSLIEDLEDEIEALERKVTSIESELSVMEKNPQEFVNNPLNAFVLIKILSHDVELIQSNLNETFTIFSDEAKKFKLPREDFEGAVEGFVRLQNVYELKSEDLAKGFIENVKIRDEFTTLEIFTLASEIMKNDRKIAAEYFEIAVEKSSEEFKFDILEKMLENYREMGKFSKAAKIVEEIVEIQGEDNFWNSLKFELSQLQDVPDKNLTSELSGSHYTWTKYHKIYSQSCMNKRTKNITETSKLYCKFHSTNAFTKIAPLKLEIVNFLPFVGIFHEVLSDNEIDILKNLTSNELTRALVKGIDGDLVTKQRTAKFKFIQDNNSKVLADVTLRVGDMSGLNMATAESLQIQNYGIGGHYNLHHDYFKDSLNVNGNRIATTLFYMTDVEKGGATVFPFLRLHVAPRKRTAVFWHNLSSSGHRETLTLHGGCPVLIGSKWVANKWLHERGQEFTRPCELHPMPTEEKNWGNLYYIL